MSTGSAPSLGFDDDSGQRPWDDDALFFNNTAQVIGELDSGIVDCSRFACMYVQGAPVGAQGRFQFQWSVDQAQTMPLRQDNIAVDPNITLDLAVNVPNSGPWVQVRCQPNGGAGQAWTPNIQCMLNNRLTTLWSLDIKTEISFTNTHLAAAGVETVYPGGYFAGRALVVVNAGATQVKVEMDYLRTTFLWVPFLLATVPANTVQTFETIWPIHATRMIRTNTDGANANNTGTVSVIPNYGT